MMPSEFFAPNNKVLDLENAIMNYNVLESIKNGEG